MAASSAGPRVPVAERLFSLVLALLATETGLTKNEILSTVQGYRQRYRAGGDNANLERQFERDKDDIRELGVPLETVDSPGDAGNNQTLRYRIPRGAYELPHDITFTSDETTLLNLAAMVWREGSLSGESRRALLKLRSLGVTADEPVLGYARTVLQSCLYVAAWMPRAILLATPIAVFFFAEGAFDEAPVAELVSGAGRTPLDATLTYVAAAILAPIAEESLFRGVLAPHLGRITDGFTAILVTAAIFGVLHVGGHGPLFVGPMFLGAILGWARLRSRGLAAPITLHMMLNGTAMALALTLGIE